jgi:serine protease Do
VEGGDIILGIDGKPVNGSAELRMRVSLMAPGTKVDVKVFRDGAGKTLPLTLAEMPAETAQNDQPASDKEDALQGITVETVTARNARQLGLPATAAGVVVTSVDARSKAADSGLKRGDVIREVNHKTVRNAAEFESAMRDAGDEALLLIERQGNTMYLAV